MTVFRNTDKNTWSFAHKLDLSRLLTLTPGAKSGSVLDKLGGVLFSDATTTKTFGPDDFSPIDEYYVRMIRAAGVGASICHTTRFYQGGVFLGEYQNSDANTF